MLSLFPKEHILSRAGDSSFILTTHRLYQEEKGFSSTQTKSIMLEHITSCESMSEKYYFWLILAVLSITLSSVSELEVIAMLGSLLFVTIFFLTKKSLIKISSPSTSMSVYIKGMSQKEIYSIIERIELAKIQRINSLK